jgi:hypothetical protein
MLQPFFLQEHQFCLLDDPVLHIGKLTMLFCSCLFLHSFSPVDPVNVGQFLLGLTSTEVPSSPPSSHIATDLSQVLVSPRQNL